MKKVFVKTLSLVLCVMLAVSVITVMPAIAAVQSNIVMVRDFNWQGVTPNNDSVSLTESTDVTFDGGKSLKWVTTNTDADWFYFNPTVAELSQYRTLYPNATVNVRFYSESAGDVFGLAFAPTQTDFRSSVGNIAAGVTINGGWQVYSMSMTTILNAHFNKKPAWTGYPWGVKFYSVTTDTTPSTIYLDSIWINKGVTPESTLANFADGYTSDVTSVGSATKLELTADKVYSSDDMTSLKWTISEDAANDYFQTSLTTANITALANEYPNAKVNLRFYSEAAGQTFGLYYAPTSDFRSSQMAKLHGVAIAGGWQVYSVSLKELADYFAANTNWNKANINAKFDAANGASGLTSGTEIYIDKMWIDTDPVTADDQLMAFDYSVSTASAPGGGTAKVCEITTEKSYAEGGSSLKWTTTAAGGENWLSAGVGTRLDLLVKDDYPNAKVNIRFYADSEDAGKAFAILYGLRSSDIRGGTGAFTSTVTIAGGWQVASVPLSSVITSQNASTANKTGFGYRINGGTLEAEDVIYIDSIWLDKDFIRMTDLDVSGKSAKAYLADNLPVLTSNPVFIAAEYTVTDGVSKLVQVGTASYDTAADKGIAEVTFANDVSEGSIVKFMLVKGIDNIIPIVKSAEF